MSYSRDFRCSRKSRPQLLLTARRCGGCGDLEALLHVSGNGATYAMEAHLTRVMKTCCEAAPHETAVSPGSSARPQPSSTAHAGSGTFELRRSMKYSSHAERAHLGSVPLFKQSQTATVVCDRLLPSYGVLFAAVCDCIAIV